MRRAFLLALLLLAACSREKDFDERYDAAAKEIETRAKAMDAALAAEEKDKAAAE